MSVSLSLNPLSLLEYFRSKGNRDRDQVAAYLEQIATDAKALAEVWDAVLTELLQRQGRFKLDDHKQLLVKLAAFKEPNAPYFSRLARFYREVSRATAGKLGAREVDSVVIALGRLLYGREITLEKYQSALRYFRDSIFAAADNSFSDFEELSTLSTALHKEAAALDVLVKTIRVQQG